MSSSENEMVYNVFQAQWNRPVKNDWTLYVKQDLKDFQMECSLDNVKAKSAESFKNLVKRKANEYEFRRLMSLKQSHTKLDNLCYTKLEMQEYLKLEKIDKVGAQTLFRYRTRMAAFGENFRGKSGPVPCPLCGNHLDNQLMGFDNCQILRENVKIEGVYKTIFSKDVPSLVVKTLIKIDEERKKLLNNK